MTGRRHFTFGAHVAVEFLLGVALCAAPFVFDFGDGATIVSLVLGVAIATVGVSTSIFGHAIPAHHGWDRFLAALLIVIAVISAIADIGVETAVFAAAAAIEAVLLAVTRYVPERT